MTRTNATGSHSHRVSGKTTTEAGSHSHDLSDIDAVIAALAARVASLEGTTPDPDPGPVFAGDPTGATDVTEALAAFLAAGGERSLARDAIYRVSHVDVRGAQNLTLRTNGARLLAAPTRDWPTLALLGCRGVTLREPRVQGAGYRWTMPTEGRHGIGVYGGADITIERPVIREVEGDGIYLGYGWGVSTPASGVVVTDPDIEASARNGIAVVAGELLLTGGRIDRAGLHCLDIEPNDATGAASCRVTAKGTRLTRANDIAEVPGLGYAVGGGWGYTAIRKPSLVLEGLTGDQLGIAVGHLERLAITGCRSDAPAIAEWWDTVTSYVAGNVNLAEVRS